MDLEAITKAVEVYCTKYRHPDLKPLEVGPLYALFPEEDVTPQAVYRWPDPWPNGDRRGVYFLFGRGVRLLYIGKASHNVIGARLGHWFQTDRPSQRCKVVHPGWTEKPLYLATLAVSDDMTFEAPALEEFLIQRLQPPDNTQGRGPRDEP